jgi:hypothetical protein
LISVVLLPDEALAEDTTASRFTSFGMELPSLERE